MKQIIKNEVAEWNRELGNIKKDLRKLMKSLRKKVGTYNYNPKNYYLEVSE